MSERSAFKIFRQKIITRAEKRFSQACPLLLSCTSKKVGEKYE